MQPYPHRYTAAATAQEDGDVALQSAHVDTLHAAPPAEFGGPGDLWSPETLVVAAVAGCFVLTFRALASRFALSWTAVTCETTGTLERTEAAVRFTAFHSRVRLHLPLAADDKQARHLLALAEERCPISSSLRAPTYVDAEVIVTAGAEAIAGGGLAEIPEG